MTRGEIVIPKKRENDVYIMNNVQNKNMSKCLIQQCRIYLQVDTLEYINAMDGSHLEKNVFYT